MGEVLTSQSGQPLRGVDALSFLESVSGEPERSRSSYWNYEIETFKVSADGTLQGLTVLGIANSKTDPLRRFMHWVLQAPYRRMGAAFPHFKEAERLGRLIASRQGRLYTGDMQRQALTLALLQANQAVPSAGRFAAVIGDGFGVMSSLLLLSVPGIKVVLVNLTKSLLLDLVQISRTVPDAGVALARDETELGGALSDPNVRLVAVRADDCGLLAKVPMELAINIHSLQEMDAPIIAEYFRLLRASPAARTLFYCCNRIEKKLNDGSITRFNDFPWSAQDECLVDEVCPWDEFVYHSRPPFWRSAPGTRHRLAVLEKGGAR